MAVTKTRAGLKLNRELRKAVHSGNGYDDYMTVYQFEQGKIAELTRRIARMQHEIDGYYEAGGKLIEDPEGVFTLALAGVRMKISYDGSGEVTGYAVDGIKGHRDTVWEMLSLFFCTHLMPIYERILDRTADQIADMDNDNVLKGLCEVRDIIRGDRYLTTAAVSGVNINTESDTDPFGIFDDSGDPDNGGGQ